MNHTESILLVMLLVIFCILVYIWETAIETHNEDCLFFLRVCLLYMAIDSF